MKNPISTRLSRHLLAVIAMSFLAGVAFMIVASSQSLHVIAASTGNGNGYLMLGPSDFAGNSDYLGMQEGLRSGYGAPIHLPQGSKISRITSYYSVLNPITFTTYISVESQSFDAVTNVITSVIAPIAQTGNYTQSTVAVSPTEIDNSRLAYRVHISTDGSPPSSPCPPGFTCGISVQASSNTYRIYQMRIDYTFDNFLPSVTR